jgi:L-fuculose-phosphate aldolase
MTEWQLRRDIVTIGLKMYEKDFVAATDGNISARLNSDRMLITPSGSCLGELTPNQLVLVDFNGRVLSGTAKPSSETPMHIMAYRQRPDVNAVIHAHPPVTTGFSVAGESLAQCVIPEIVVVFGTIPTAEYATASSDEGAHVIKGLIGNHDAIILDRHGTLTVGIDLVDAFRKLEKVEHCARVTLTARQLGRVKKLSAEEIKKLEEVRKKMGYADQVSLCERCGVCIVPD